MHNPNLDLEDEDLSLPNFDDAEDFDVGGKNQSAYHEACRVYEEKLAARKAMKPKQRAAAAEQERCQAVLRMLHRPPSSDSDMNAFYIMISDTPDQVNRPLDPAGNTLAHYLANPNETVGSWDGDQPIMRPTTERERQAFQEWAEVILQWAGADPFIRNNQGITAVDIACTVSPDHVELLTYFDKHTKDREKGRAVARAVFMAAAGQAQEKVTKEQVVDAMLSLGTFIDSEGGFLLCGNQLRSTETFREFLLSDAIQDKSIRNHIRTVLLPKADAAKL